MEAFLPFLGNDVLLSCAFRGSAAALPWKYTLQQWLDPIKTVPLNRFYGMTRPRGKKPQGAFFRRHHYNAHVKKLQVLRRMVLISGIHAPPHKSPLKSVQSF